MFRRLESGLPEDPHFPADLHSLGFFINDKYQIRRIKNPHQEFIFRITNDERTNEVHREAFHRAVRNEIHSRLKDLGTERLHLPQLTSNRPRAPHVPIILTPIRQLRVKKRVFVVVNDEFQDLGIWAWRMLGRHAGIESGSCVALLKELIDRSQKQSNGGMTSQLYAQSPMTEEHHGIKDEHGSPPPGLIVLNPGELLYSYRLNDSMSRRTWMARNVASTAHSPVSIHPENYVQDNKTPEEHVACVFDNVLANNTFVHEDAEIYVIAMQDRGDLVLQYLNDRWSSWSGRIKAIALMEPRHRAKTITNPSFGAFLEQRGRAWSVSSAPLGVAIATPSVTVDAKWQQGGSRVVDNQQTMLPARNPPDESFPAALPRQVIDWCENVHGRSSMGTPREFIESASESHMAKDAVQGDSVVTANQTTGDEDFMAVTQPTYSAGELVWAECIFPTVYKTVIDWFEEVAQDPSQYRNPPLLASELWQREDDFASDAHDEQGISDDEAETRRPPEPNEHGEKVLDYDAGTEAITQDEVEGIAFAEERKYSGGEIDAMDEHGGFVAKEVEEPTITIGGAELPASLINDAGLGNEDSGIKAPSGHSA